MKKLLTIILLFLSQLMYGQNLLLPSFSEGAPNNYFTAGNGDGGTLSVYNVFLKLHTGLAIGSPYGSNGQGGFVEMPTLAIDSRTGNLTTRGNITGSNAAFGGNVGIGTSNPTAYFPGRVLEISDNRPILKLSPTGEGGLGTILFKGAYNSTSGSKDEFHFNYISSQTNPRLVIGGFNGNGDGIPVVFTMLGNGNIGIGTEAPTTKLSVNGNIRAKEVKVETNNWPDFVFKKDYTLTSLPDLEKYILLNNHLPEIPSAIELEKDGVSLGAMNKLLVKKIEELTLHLIEKEKQLDAQQEQIRLQNSRMDSFEKSMKILLNNK